MALTAVGELTAAIKYGIALKIQPNYVDAWYQSGNTLVQLRKLKDTIKYYKRATEIDVRYFQAWFGCAQAWHNLGNYNNALVSCNTSLERNPYDEQGCYQQGIILSGLGNL